MYDALAPYYDLIYPDWDASMRRQGAALAALIPGTPAASRILDVSAGIGTQALALATLGYEVVARDVSEGAVRRLAAEAAARGLPLDTGVADMRRVADTVTGEFDAVVSLDNSVPHLLGDDDILAALEEMRRVLAPSGVVLVSLRDYDTVDRSPTSVHDYGVRARDGVTYRLRQEWSWTSATHYRTTMVVERLDGTAWTEVARGQASYHAVTIPRMLALMGRAGLRGRRATESDFFQPVLVATAR